MKGVAGVVFRLLRQMGRGLRIDPSKDLPLRGQASANQPFVKALFPMPTITPSGPTLLLDVGGGEIGLYSFSLGAEEGPTVAGGRKHAVSFEAAMGELRALGRLDAGRLMPGRECYSIASYLAKEVHRLRGDISTRPRV